MIINDHQPYTISPMMSAMGVVSRMFWPLCCTRFWRLATKSSLRHVFSMGGSPASKSFTHQPNERVVHDIRGSTALVGNLLVSLLDEQKVFSTWNLQIFSVTIRKFPTFVSSFPLSYVGLVISPYTQVQI